MAFASGHGTGVEFKKQVLHFIAEIDASYPPPLATTNHMDL